MRAGALPDLYFGDQIRAAWKLEDGDWWFTREFVVDAEARLDDWVLRFEGIDTFAEVFLNDVSLGQADNMLIAHEFPAASLRHGVNRVTVHISSVLAAAGTRDYAPLDDFLDDRLEALWVRKAPASFGWDIAPRLLTHGLWKSVTLEQRSSTRIVDLQLRTVQLESDSAIMELFYRVELAGPAEAHSLRVRGVQRDGSSEFEYERALSFVAGKSRFTVDDPHLWWPRGYGSANLYDVTVTLLHNGEPVDMVTFATGIRTIDLDRGASRWSTLQRSTTEDFRVRVNGTDIFASGTNWVPLDAIHALDASRLDAAIRLLDDVGGNIVRCWGGNVYESDEFYDRCDELGLLVWQDFALACGRYPQTEAFAAQIRSEATAVVRRLRNHPSLFLWAGNNENDQIWDRDGIDPNNDWIARDVLRDVVLRQDPGRDYLPSSPFYAAEAFESGTALPEQHLWGPRASFKSPFYTAHGAAFVSEIGYHGLPSRASLRRFLPADRLTPDPSDDLWQLHETLQVPRGVRRSYSRTQLLLDQASLLFGLLDPTDLTAASQIAQAEAKKFFVESARLSVDGQQSGVIWWNLLDGWPQVSDAVVDYYFVKKLAYYFLRVSQQPILFAADETSTWSRRFTVSNNTRHDAGVDLQIEELGGAVLWQGRAQAPAGRTTTVVELPISVDRDRCLLLSWDRSEHSRFGANHYIERQGRLNLTDYKLWLDELTPRYGIAREELWGE
jgi:beta-mannosidase